MQRNGGKEHVTYRQFKLDPINRHRDRRSDFELKLISNRNQNHRDKEEFLEFFEEIQLLCSRLRKPLSEEELIEIILRDMRAGLQISLANE